jgi:hypothetical protein
MHVFPATGTNSVFLLKLVTSLKYSYEIFIFRVLKINQTASLTLRRDLLVNINICQELFSIFIKIISFALNYYWVLEKFVDVFLTFITNRLFMSQPQITYFALF